ncbi:hypothetical protein OROMI_008971 [Orobanche minor]
MSGWRGISVSYGGYWDDNSSYIGGSQSIAYVRTDDIRISELRENINYFMMANSLSTTYQLHYLSRSCRGRIIKSVLSSDDELTRACNADAELEVYAMDDAGTSQQEQEVYRPSFEIQSTSRDIMDDVLREYGIEASYSVAMRARNWAIELIYGGHEASFQMLPQYLHMLPETNPGTVTDLDIGPDGRFQHLFVALGSCRLAYTLCLRPVIVVDGTHLKGRNNGILFIAVTKDGNEQIFPLAYGVGPVITQI